jgi:magnesium-transporting ATPase (P-type)
VLEIHSIALQAGQAALTGESASVQKTVKPMAKDIKILQD